MASDSVITHKLPIHAQRTNEAWPFRHQISDFLEAQPLDLGMWQGSAARSSSPRRRTASDIEHLVGGVCSTHRQERVAIRRRLRGVSAQILDHALRIVAFAAYAGRTARTLTGVLVAIGLPSFRSRALAARKIRFE